MQNAKRMKLEELRQPGMRRLLDAMKQIEEEAPGLLDEAALAAIQLTKGRDNGGHNSPVR
jgi:hypothetical protein